VRNFLSDAAALSATTSMTTLIFLLNAAQYHFSLLGSRMSDCRAATIVRISSSDADAAHRRTSSTHDHWWGSLTVWPPRVSGAARATPLRCRRRRRGWGEGTRADAFAVGLDEHARGNGAASRALDVADSIDDGAVRDHGCTSARAASVTIRRPSASRMSRMRATSLAVALLESISMRRGRGAACD
jgi:hypothetical protein